MSTILNTPSSNHSLYIESHYKKFWLRKSETELKHSTVSTAQASKPPPLVSTSTVFHTVPRNSTAKDKGCSSLWESPQKVGKAKDNCYPSTSLWSISESDLSIAPLSRSLVVVDRQCFDQIQDEKPVANTGADFSPLSEESGRRVAAKAVLSLPDNAEERDAMEDEQRCTRCGTNKTPMWRSGPFGHKTLCNACGIRYKKFKSKSSISSEEQQKNEDQQSPRYHRSPSFLTTSAKRKMDYQQSSVSQQLRSPKRAKLSDLVERTSSKSAISAYQIANDVVGKRRNSSMCSGKNCYPFAKDEEEGAAILMALSSSSFA